MKKLTFSACFFSVFLLAAFTVYSFKKDSSRNNNLSVTKLDLKNMKKVLISTKFGDIKIALYNETPQHRDNFIKLVQNGFYDSLLFHRVIANFMIQGGDPNSKNAKSGQPLGMGGPGYTIPAEILPQFIHKKGALAAARQGDAVNPKKESSGSQFYIVQGNVVDDEQLNYFSKMTGKTYSEEVKTIYKTIGGTPHLDGEYTVFGEVYEGLEVIDKIASVPVDGQSRPKEDLIMTIKMIENESK